MSRLISLLVLVFAVSSISGFSVDSVPATTTSSIAEDEPVTDVPVPEKAVVGDNKGNLVIVEEKQEILGDALASTQTPIINNAVDRKEPVGTLPPDYGQNTTEPPPVTGSDQVQVTKDQTQDVAIITRPIGTRGETCYCGTPVPSKIVNGEAALIREYPWTVGLLRRGFLGFGGSSKPFCGGTLINDRYVVTASHCVDGQVASNLQVLVNEQDLQTTTEANTRKFEVERIIMHETYDRRTIDNDIALIKLAQPIVLTDNFVRPACLPANNDNDFSNLTATAAGWGTTTQGGSQSPILLKVEVPIISNDVCNSDQTKYKGKISPNMICAGFLGVGGKDACQGDSGGPLTIPNGGRTTLIGVVSWGYGCAKADSPGVYTRVARYPDWILKHTSDATWCS